MNRNLRVRTVPYHIVWIAALVLFFDSARSFAQCGNNNTAIAGGAITIPCPGSAASPPCVRGGRYALVNVTNGNTYTFATCGGNVYDTYITLYNNSGGGALAWDNDGCGTQSSVTWTATFTGQVRALLDRGAGCNNSNQCTTLNISCATGAPANDLICSATTLTANTNCVNASPSPTNVNATNTAGPPAPGCANYVSGDVWFKVVVPLGGAVTITTSSISTSALLDAGLAVYSSSNNLCSGVLTLLGCNDDINFPYNQMSSLALTGLTVGNTLFIRVWQDGNTLFGPFNICATTPILNGDDPCGANSISVANSCSYTQFSNTTATHSATNPAPACGNFIGGSKDIWVSFTAPTNGKVVIQTDAISLTDAAMALYSTNTGLCAGTFTLLACDDDSGEGFMPFLSQTGLTAGTTYWLRIWGYGAATGTFNVCIWTPLGLRQEDCLGSYTVCDNQYVLNTSLFVGNAVDLSASNYGCLSSGERQGQWWVFSPTASGDLGFTLSPLANDDYDFAIWGPYASGSRVNTVCIPNTAPIRCSYSSGANTLAATGSYNTGLASGTYSPPQFTSPTPGSCASCTENSGGDGWVSGMNVTAGQVYLLYISNFSQTGSAFNLTWTLQNGAALSCGILPVEFLGLSADAQGSSVNLRWTTLSEHNSDYFSIERSSDGEHFIPVGAMDAAGDSQQRIDYSFTDVWPLLGADYYRLKQVDTDGAYEYTRVVVTFMGEKDDGPVLFPNPVETVLHASFNMSEDGDAIIQVIDASGRVMRDHSAHLDHGMRTLDVDMTGLNAGPYELRISGSGKTPPASVSFIKE